MEDKVIVYFEYDYEKDTAAEILDAYGEYYEYFNTDLMIITKKGLDILLNNGLNCHIAML